MTQLKVPSLQHLARNWRNTPEKVEKSLVDLAKNKPPFSYEALNKLAQDVVRFKCPEDQIAEGIRKQEKREWVRSVLLDVVPLLCNHFHGIQQDYVVDVAPRYYSLGKNLLIPFKPPLAYGLGGQIYFPWFSFWKSNPIADENLSLFVTLVKEMLLQDPDLEDARFQILDFSAQVPNEHRRLEIIEGSDVAILNEHRKNEMLEVFVEGFLRAEKKLAGIERHEKGKEKVEIANENQLILFP